jgi:mRNA interferase HicA
MKKSTFEKHLKNNHCRIKREGANHEVWINLRNNKISTVPRHKELKNLLCKKICKDLDIPSIE